MRIIAILFLLLASATSVFSQIVRYDGFIAPAGFNNPAANVAVCSSGGSGGPPCSPLAVIYSDPSGTFQQTNPFQSQVNGRYTFFAPAGSYVVQTYGTGYTTTLTNVTLSSSGSGSSSGSSIGNNATSPLSFGAKWDVKFLGDAQWSNSSSTVTCPNSDCNFTSADIGKIIFGTTCTAQINATMLTGCAVLIPQGTISAVGSTSSITVSTTSTGSCTASSSVTCFIAWGTQDDTTAITNASTAAFNTAGANCALSLPAGAAFVSAALFNGPGNNRCWQGAGGATAIADLASIGPVVYGVAAGATVLIPLPSFNFSSCTGGAGSNVCFGAMGNLHAHDFSINGLGQPVGSTHALKLWSSEGTAGGGACDGGTTMWNMSFSTWAWNTTSSIGLALGGGACNDPVYWNINISAFGANPLNLVQASGGTLSLTGIFAWGGSSYTVTINSNGTINSSGSQYYGPLSGGVAIFQCNGAQTGKFVSKGDGLIYTNGAPSTESIAICNVGSQFFDFESDTLSIAAGTTGTSQIFFLAGGNTIHLKNSIVTFSGTNNRLFSSAATDQIFDDGGNTFGTPGSTNSTSGGDFIADGHSLKGSCTGTATASSTLGLYNSGPNVSVTTCTSTNIGNGIPMAGARTLFGLVVKAGTGGVNSSSGVFTVLKNGVSTTITCTMGTGTSCTDFTHSVSTADGDLISIQFTTQTAETLANIKAITEWQ